MDNCSHYDAQNLGSMKITCLLPESYCKTKQSYLKVGQVEWPKCVEGAKREGFKIASTKTNARAPKHRKA